MNLRVLAITIFCLVYLAKQGSTSRIKTIRRIVYDEDHYEPCRHQHKVKYDFEEPPACDCSFHDEQLPEISFYQLGKYLTGEQLLRRFEKITDDLSALNPRLRPEDDSFTDVDPRFFNKFNQNKDNSKRTLPALDPRLRPTKNENNPPQTNPPAANPPPKNPAPENPTPENPPPETPTPENPPSETPTPENPPPTETEPVITPEQWAEFIGSLTPGSIAWQNRNVNTRGRIQ